MVSISNCFCLTEGISSEPHNIHHTPSLIIPLHFFPRASPPFHCVCLYVRVHAHLHVDLCVLQQGLTQ